MYRQALWQTCFPFCLNVDSSDLLTRTSSKGFSFHVTLSYMLSMAEA